MEMRRKLGLRTTIGAMVLASGVIIPPQASQADTVNFPYIGMTTQSAISGVVGRDGTAVSGADVVAVAHSNAAAIESTPEGGTLPTLVVAAASTNAVGRFSINVDRTALPSAYIGAGGEVNLELVIADDQKEIRWDTTALPAQYPTPVGGGEELCGPDVTYGCDLGDPVYIVAGTTADQTEPLNVVVATAQGATVIPSWSSAKAQQAGASLPAQLIVDLGTHPTVQDANDNPASWINAPRGPTASSEDEPPPAVMPPVSAEIGAAEVLAAKAVEAAPRSSVFQATADAIQSAGVTTAEITAGRLAAARYPGPNCGYATKILKKYYNQGEVYAPIYNYLGAKATVEQHLGSTHTISVGYKSTASGNYSASGSVSITVSGEAKDTRKGVVNKWLVGGVHVALKASACQNNPTRKLVPYAIGDAILLTSWATHRNFSKQCILYSEQGTYEKSHGRSATVNGAMEILGFSASAQNGFNANAKYTLDISLPGTKICGNGRSVRESSIIDARPA
ncbi:hypothetical protein AB0M95_09730 [Sphaerisporangium sp. NPDC051017]|uniref:hypothetical protein n=1 Tax=Sphaerisporangium sp. NPDC051017 TaxID=3154636 RepID=UPI003431A8E4